MINQAKREFYGQQIELAKHSSKQLFDVVKELAGKNSDLAPPPSQTLCDSLAQFFFTKVNDIYSEFSSRTNADTTRVRPEQIDCALAQFKDMDNTAIKNIINQIKSGSALDPCPPKILLPVQESIIDTITRICNMLFETGIYPDSLKNT